jgi:hypothetical protein
MKKSELMLAAAASVVLAVTIFTGVVFGQIPVNPDLVLVESGNKMGIAYRGPGPEDATQYVEHWILFPGYAYPGTDTLATLELTPGAGQYFESESDFFTRAPFPAGSKYVRAYCEEFTKLPGRR